MNESEAAAFLHIKVRQLQELRKRGGVPHMRITRKVTLYRREDLDAWLNIIEWPSVERVAISDRILNMSKINKKTQSPTPEGILLECDKNFHRAAGEEWHHRLADVDKSLQTIYDLSDESVDRNELFKLMSSLKQNQTIRCQFVEGFVRRCRAKSGTVIATRVFELINFYPTSK